VVSRYLAGQPTNPVEQGKAVALAELCHLLELSPDQLSQELLKEQ
jgi:hypothetical protein